MKHLFNTALIALVILTSCNQQSSTDSAESANSTENQIEMKKFGTLEDSTEVESYTLKNANGIEMEVITYGGIITKLLVPDKNGNFEDVVLGFNDLQSYIDGSPYFGAIIGRYGNRIANGKFTLDGEEYTLPTNNGPNSLHGGDIGFDKVVWEAEPFTKEGASGIVFTYTSEDGEMGYPGKLDVEVIYTLGDDNTLAFEYKATTDKTTVVNLTNHSYFNLSAMKNDILSHELKLNAPGFLPVDSTLIPTGEVRPVASTPFDFTETKVIGKEIEVENEQLKYGMGYDHCWVLAESDEELTYLGTLSDPESGRKMDVHTSEPAVQFYSGNFLDGSLTGKNGETYEFRNGMCLETQHYPDSPNKPDFPSTVLKPGETYTSKTVHKFYTEE